MAKIMIVEDDNNLREIYQARLMAEGYDIVSAPDGEAGLAMANANHPDLIISDVMMPKISGFEMLDILRNTPNMHDVKIIMLTALGQAEDNARAGALGANRYLVKSQVTLEDIVKAAHDLLEGPAGEPVSAPAIVTDSVVPAAVPPADTYNAAVPATPPAPTPAAVPDLVLSAEPLTDLASVPADIPVPVAVDTPSVATPVASDDTAAADDLNIADTPEPVAEPVSSEIPPSVDEAETQLAAASAESSAQAESVLHDQINSFLESQPSEEPADDTPLRDLNLDSSIGTHSLISTPPAELPDDSYDEDDQAPDMGTMELHTPPSDPTSSAITEDQEPPHPAPLPEAPPVVAEPPVAATPVEAVEPAPAPEPSQGVVADAINTMMAGAPAETTRTVLPPSQAWQQPAPAVSEDPAAPVNDDAVKAASTRKKIIEPLPSQARPDIHQLLSMEEARSGAQQASQQPSQPRGPVDPNSISL